MAARTLKLFANLVLRLRDNRASFAVSAATAPYRFASVAVPWISRPGKASRAVAEKRFAPLVLELQKRKIATEDNPDRQQRLATDRS